MLLALFAILFGLGLLVWGADRFVVGSAALARNLGLPPLLIGLTVVGLGTSAPEILVSAMASIQDTPGIAIGNAVGSNIANIALILGTTALVAPLTVQSGLVRREYPLLLVVSIGVYLVLFDGDLDRPDGALLLGGLLVVLFIMVQVSREREPGDPLAAELNAEIPRDVTTPAAVAWLVVGLATLVVSSRILVWGAVEIATLFGVSELVIGLTIVAVGTSLPELAAAVMSALKNEPDLAIGNIVGSNIWNLLAVLSVPGLLAPGLVPPEAIGRDMLVMLALTLALFAMGRSSRSRGVVNRTEGALLLATFIGYQAWLGWDAYQHAGA